MKIWPYVILVVLAFVFTIPLLSGFESTDGTYEWKSLKMTMPELSHLQYTGIADWDYVCFQNEVARQSILEYGQFPFWNPYASGGRPLLANHQNGFLRPLFLMTLFFGCAVGSKIEIFLMVAVGMIGMFLLSTYYEMHPLAGLMSSVIFGMTSFFSLHISEGHFIFVSFYLVPYIFLFYLKSFEKSWWIILSAAFTALVILGGGAAYVLIPLPVFLGTYALICSIKRKTIKPLISLFLMLILALGFAGVKSFPALVYNVEHPRLTIVTEFTPFFSLYDIFLSRNQGQTTKHFEGQPRGWHEYGAYVGWLPAVLFLIGLAMFFKAEIALIGAGVLSLLISMGNLGRFSPWSLLHNLPIVESTHVPSRFIIMFIFCLAIIAGLAFDALLRKPHQTKVKYVCAALLLLVALDLWMVSGKSFARGFHRPPLLFDDNSEFKQIVDTNWGRSGASSSMYLNMRGHNGTLNAYDPVYHPTYALPVTHENYTGEVYLENGGAASYSYWSPNKLRVEFKTDNQTMLIINQNYDVDWFVDGKPAENATGLLAASVTPEMSSVEFSYMPWSFVIGIIITLLTVLSAVAWVYVKTRK